MTDDMAGGERSQAALIVLGGSTASGKSALALRLAALTDATIVNADSQQLFRDLPILTAQPPAADLAAAPHRLYGVLAAAEQPSVGAWLALATPLLAEAVAAERTLILTGGSGLYLQALLRGLPQLPRVEPEFRRRLEDEAAGRPTGDLHGRLTAADPVMAARLRPSDRQRILRALEVVLATGRSLAEWQKLPREAVARPARTLGLALLPPATLTAGRIDARLAVMLENGATAEVADLAAREPELLAMPIRKVHGLRELLAVGRGKLPLAAATALIAAQIRQYAKRQRTFFRHQLPELRAIAATGEAVDAPRLLAQLG